MAYPKGTQIVVNLLRANVPKPTNLPKLWGERGLRWTHPCKLVPCCPLGLLPAATLACPVGPCSIGVSNDTWDPVWDPAITAFIGWWDSQTDPKAAVEAVWGD